MKILILHIALLLFPFCVIAQNSQELWFNYLVDIDNHKDYGIPEQLINDLQTNPGMAVYLAERLHQNGMIEPLKPLINMHPDDAGMKYYAALFYAQHNEPQKSIQMLADHIKSSERKLRGNIRSEKSFDPVKSSSAWRSFWIQDHYRKRDLTYEAALNFYHDGDYNWALEELNPLLTQYPSNHKYLYLAALLYDEMGNQRLAMNYIKKATEASPRKASYHAAAARLYLKNNNIRLSVEAAEKTLELAPWVPDYYPLAAKTFIAGKQYAAAVETLENYCHAFSDTEAWYLMAKAKFHQQNYHDVIRWMNKALEADKSHYNYFVIRADAFRETRSYENAFKDYAMALDIKPNLPQVYINYGRARFDTGDTQGACYLWRKALHYKHPEANDYLYRYCPQQY
ncbi:MAG: tetratricopeptide repeat protein [Bacteroidales bacterium]